MRRQVPLALCFVFGVVMVLIEFSPHPYSKSLYNEVINWSLIIGPFALVLGVATLVQTHWIRIRRSICIIFLSIFNLLRQGKNAQYLK